MSKRQRVIRMKAIRPMMVLICLTTPLKSNLVSQEIRDLLPALESGSIANAQCEYPVHGLYFWPKHMFHEGAAINFSFRHCQKERVAWVPAQDDVSSLLLLWATNNYCRHPQTTLVWAGSSFSWSSMSSTDAKRLHTPRLD